MTSLIAVVLVGVQFIAILFILLTGPLVAKNPVTFFIEILGLLLSFWAIREVKKKSRLQISPKIAKGGNLVTSGPYRYIRHPMYASILLIIFSLIIELPLIERIIIGAILFLDLIIKLNFEEKLLKLRFSEYKNYQKATKRLIPFVY